MTDTKPHDGVKSPFARTPPRQMIPRQTSPPRAPRKKKRRTRGITSSSDDDNHTPRPPKKRTKRAPSLLHPQPPQQRAQRFDLTSLPSTIHSPYSSSPPPEPTPVPKLTWSTWLWDFLHTDGQHPDTSDIEDEIVTAWLNPEESGAGGCVLVWPTPFGSGPGFEMERLGPLVEGGSAGEVFTVRWDSGTPATRCLPGPQGGEGKEVLAGTVRPLDFEFVPPSTGSSGGEGDGDAWLRVGARKVPREKGSWFLRLLPSTSTVAPHAHGLVINDLLIPPSTTQTLLGPLPNLAVITDPRSGSGMLFFRPGTRMADLRQLRAHGVCSLVAGGRDGPRGWKEGGGGVEIVDLAGYTTGFRVHREKRKS